MTDRTAEETKLFAYANNDAFSNSVSSALKDYVESLPQRIDVMHAPMSIKLAEVLKVADHIFSEAAAFSACAKSCSHCCYQAVPIASYEAQYIGEKIGTSPVELKQSISRDVKSFSDQTPCSFLVGGECSIYQYRPLTCRTHVNFDRDNYWCRYENWDKPYSAVPKPIFTPLLLAYHQLAGKFHPIVGDIRDFFPI